MSHKSVNYLAQSYDWEFGVEASLVAVNEGADKNFSTSTFKYDACAFINVPQG